MRIGILAFRFLVVTGIIFALFAVTFFVIQIQEVYAANSSTESPQKVSLIDRIFAQIGGVVTFSAQTIQAVMDLDANSFSKKTSDPDNQNNNVDTWSNTKKTSANIPDILIPKLPSTDSGSLKINVPFEVTDTLTVQGQSNLGATTINGLFIATTKAELNSLLVRGKTELENLAVAGIADINILNVLGRATLRSLSVRSDAEVLGVLTTKGGIKTNGADVDLAEGRLFASNVINSLIAGSNITITGTPNAPIISAKKSGSSHPDLAAVRTRGGCPECITDSDVVPTLTIAGGSINSSAIGLSAAAAAAFTDVNVGTTSATSTLQVDGRLVLNGLLRVFGTATSTFDGGINVTGGCVAVNGTCLGNGVSVLDDLLDVDASSPNDGEILMFDGTNWVSAATSSLGIGAEQLAELNDVLLSTSTIGDLLSFNGTSWTNIATSTLGLGDGSFLGLRDTPSSYIANAISYVNSTSSALTQSANFVFDGTRLGIGTSSPITTLSVLGTVGVLGQQALQFYNSANTNYVGFRASSTLSTNTLWSLPISDGASNQILVTNGAGSLRFASVSSVGGGSDTFLGLTDTVNAFIDKAIPFVSSSSLAFSTGLVFDGTHLGIGNTSPTSALTVQGAVRFQSGTTTVGFSYDNVTDRVGIGTTNPSQKFVLEGGSFLQRGAASGSTYTPTQLGSLDLPDNANDVAVVGTYAYVVTAGTGNDFHIINISDSAAPVEAGSLNIAGSVNAVVVSGRYAYVASDVTGNDFHVIDISNATAPVEVSSINLVTSATDVFIQEQYAYVVTVGAGDDFHVIDISNPLAPVEIGSVALPDGANAVTVSDNYAYVATNDLADGLHIINISTSTLPVVTGSVDLAGAANDVFVQGNYAYAVSDSTGNDFHVINISNPAAPTEVGSLDLVTSANAVSIAGHYAYVATAGTGNDFHVIDITSSAAPAEVGSEDLASGSGLAVTVSGKNAYVVTSSVGNDFHVMDVSGIDVQSAFVNSLAAGMFTTQGDLSVAGNASFGRGLRTGIAGIQTDGELYVQGTGSSFIKSKLGIGTTTPVSILDIKNNNGNTAYGNNLSLLRLGNTSNNSSAVPGNGFEVSAAGDLLGFDIGSNAHTASYNTNTVTKDYAARSGLVMRVNNQSAGGTGSSFEILTAPVGSVTLASRMLIDGSGYVGIGTTTPNTALNVVGTIKAIRSGVPTQYVNMFASGGSGLIQSSSGMNLELGSGPSSHFVINTSGNVGIGTTSPAARLAVSQSSNSLYAGHLYNGGGSGLGLLIQAGSVGNTSAVPLYIQDISGNSLFKVRGDGNVGIGTANPQAKLYINATAATNEAIGLPSYGGTLVLNGYSNTLNAAGGLEFKSRADSNGSGWRISAPDQTNGSVTTDFVLESRQLTATWSERMRILANGNVGIGTTTPNAKLDIQGNQSGYIWSARSVVGSSTAQRLDYWSTSGAGSPGPRNSLLFYNGAFEAYDSTNGASRIFIASTTGNTGLGDTTPSEAKLVIGSAGSGNAYLTLDTGGTTNNAVCWDNTGATLLYDCDATPADYAESYPTANNVTFGHIVMTTTQQITQTDGEKVPMLEKAQHGQGTILGITSNNYHDFTSAGLDLIPSQYHPLPVALNGRVPVKINLEGGPIAVGDAITLSSVAGVGKKATESGETTIGIALAPYTSNTSGDTVLVFVQNDTYSSEADLERALLFATLLDTTATTTFTLLLQNDTDTIWNRLTTLAQGFVGGVLTIVGIDAEEVITDRLCVGLTCVTETQLKALLEDAGSQDVVDDADPSNDENDSATTTPVDDGSDENEEILDQSASSTEENLPTEEQPETTQDLENETIVETESL